MDKRGRLAPRG